MATDKIIVVDRMPTETIRFTVVGMSPLLVNRFSEKARREMLDKQQGRRSPRQHKDPEALFQAARYLLPDGRDGFPVLAFKAATVGAARFYKGSGLTMVSVRQGLFFTGAQLSANGQDLLYPITGEPKLREDAVRNASGVADLRYRAEFVEWTATLEITYVTTMTKETVLNLVDAGGFGIGVGDWRPERKGQNGTYMVPSDAKVETVERD